MGTRSPVCKLVDAYTAAHVLTTDRAPCSRMLVRS